jgi:phospholipase C
VPVICPSIVVKDAGCIISYLFRALLSLSIFMTYVCVTTKGAYQGRCGYGPRLPMLVISPYAKVNYIDHTITDHTSILRFIEDNWGLGKIGDQSFDAKAGSILSMFNFIAGQKANKLFLDPDTGTITSEAVASQVFALPF